VAVLVIAGSGRGAGKTAVGCALMAALPELRWVAVKVSPHLHRDEAIWEEWDLSSDKDTGRYLAAGAVQAFLISDAPDSATSTLDVLWSVPRSGSLLVESNRIDGALVAMADEPVVSLAVLAGVASEWKASLWARFETTDALVLTGGLTCEELPAELQAKPVFRLIEGQWSSPELVRFVRARLLPIQD
jgi:hypothetical protein